MRKGQQNSEENKRQHSEFMKEYYKTHKSPRLGKSHSVESKQKMSKALKGRVFSEEWKRNISKGKKGKTTVSEGAKKKISNTLMGHKHSDETKEKIRQKHLGRKNPHKGKSYVELFGEEKAREILEKHKGNLHPHFRDDITEERILKAYEEVINEHGKELNRANLDKLARKQLECSFGVVSRVCGSIDNILDKLGITLATKNQWEEKQDLIEEVIKEYEPDLKVRQFHKGIGYPDFETPDTIYDAKSYLYMGWQDQLDRYSQLNKDVKFVVFEDKGETDIPRERIIILKELVKDLPNGKRLLIQEKIERIKRGIPLEQKSLINDRGTI